jgi:hypothetical protein
LPFTLPELEPKDVELEGRPLPLARADEEAKGALPASVRRVGEDVLDVGRRARFLVAAVLRRVPRRTGLQDCSTIWRDAWREARRVAS